MKNVLFARKFAQFLFPGFENDKLLADQALMTLHPMPSLSTPFKLSNVRISIEMKSLLNKKAWSTP